MLNGQPDLARIITGLIFAIILAIISYRLKALSLSGAVGTTVVGAIVFGLGGLTCAAPLLFFFIASSWLSRLKSDIKSNSLKAVDKTGPRDIYQVFANGGVAAICVLAGFGGSIIDSILGATVQGIYRCRVCGSLIEHQVHCQNQADLIKGFKIINNDMVNLLSNLAAVAIMFVIIFAY